jgi:hypothetical protein
VIALDPAIKTILKRGATGLCAVLGGVMTAAAASEPVKFDTTITLGSVMAVITLLGVVATTIMAAVKYVHGLVDDLRTERVEADQAILKSLEHLHECFEARSLEVAGRVETRHGENQQKLATTEARLAVIESRVNDLWEGFRREKLK